MANDPNTIQYVIQEDGFWYVASKDRTPGVPEITVSTKGVANGLSTEYNDGWDFGPDSYDPNSTASIPYTQTSGIQEAVNYSYSVSYPISSTIINPSGVNVGPTIKLVGSTYAINQKITIPYDLSINIEGAGHRLTILDASSLSGNIIYWNKSTGAAPINGGTYYTWGNKISGFTLLTGNTSTTEYSMDFSQPEGAYRYTIDDIYIVDPDRTSLSLNVDGLEGSILQQVTAATISYQCPYGGTHFYHAVMNYLNISSTNSVLLNCTIYNQITMYGVGGGNRSVHNFIGGYIGTSNGSSKGNLIMNVTTSPASTHINIIGALWFMGGGSTYPNRPMITGVSDAPVNVTLINLTVPNNGYTPWPIFDSTFASGTSLFALKMGTEGSMQFLTNNSTLSVPSVPASGTAQSNSNPIPMNVYIYGGDVTKIQITKDGTTYTVLSVSTAIAMSGQVYRLNPGDSITLTYSTVPDWEWLAE